MSGVNLTARQLEILVAFVTEAKTEVDWAKVAEKSNCKTGKYARDQFANIRKLLQSSVGGVADNTNGDTSNGVAPTPNSKTNKKNTPASKRKKAREETADDDEETPTKKKVNARKSKSQTPAETEVAEEETKANGPNIKAEPNDAGELMDDMF